MGPTVRHLGRPPRLISQLTLRRLFVGVKSWLRRVRSRRYKKGPFSAILSTSLPHTGSPRRSGWDHARKYSGSGEKFQGMSSRLKTWYHPAGGELWCDIL